MTSLESALKHKQPEHDAIASDINAWLDKGHVIQKLGNTPIKSGGEYNSRSFDFTERK